MQQPPDGGNVDHVCTFGLLEEEPSDRREVVCRLLTQLYEGNPSAIVFEIELL
jgi:hypothetical protein